jgi:hypothetical protein
MARLSFIRRTPFIKKGSRWAHARKGRLRWRADKGGLRGLILTPLGILGLCGAQTASEAYSPCESKAQHQFRLLR